MKNKNKWVIEQCDYPLNQVYNANFRIVENNEINFPICHLPNSNSKKQTKALLNKQEEYAKLIASAPELLETLEEMVNTVSTIVTTNADQLIVNNKGNNRAEKAISIAKKIIEVIKQAQV